MPHRRKRTCRSAGPFMHGPVNNHSTVFCWGKRERGGDSPLGDYQSACGEATVPKKGLAVRQAPGGKQEQKNRMTAPHGESARGEGTPLSVIFNLPVAKPRLRKKGLAVRQAAGGKQEQKNRMPRPAWGERERGGDSPLGEFQSACGEATVPEKKDLPKGKSFFSGASGRIRTGDLLITNQLRYQLRYRSKASVFQSRGVL